MYRESFFDKGFLETCWADNSGSENMKSNTAARIILNRVERATFFILGGLVLKNVP